MNQIIKQITSAAKPQPEPGECISLPERAFLIVLETESGFFSVVSKGVTLSTVYIRVAGPYVTGLGKEFRV